MHDLLKLKAGNENILNVETKKLIWMKTFAEDRLHGMIKPGYNRPCICNKLQARV